MKRIKMAIGVLSVALGAGMAFGCSDKGAETYKVNYSYGGSAYTIDVADGGNYVMESIPTKDGYVFDGLYDAEIGGVQYVGSDGACLRPFYNGKDITLFVRFTPLNYSIEFVYDNGTLSSNATINVDNGNQMPDLPTLTALSNHKTFGGWYTATDNGDAVTDASGKVTEGYKTFDCTKLERGENNTVKLYAAYEVEKYSVKFYKDIDGEKKLIEERQIEYGTDIYTAALGIEVDGESVLAWSSEKSEIYTGIINSDCEMYVKCIGTVIDLETQPGTITLSGDNANAMLRGDKNKTYENVNIMVSNDSVAPSNIIMYNANIVGDSSISTICSSGGRRVNIFSVGEKNSIGTSVNGATAVKVDGEKLAISCDANLTIIGGDGVTESDGTNGGVGISARNLEVDAKACTLTIGGGNGGNAKNRQAGENDGEGSNGRNGYNGGNGGDGVYVGEKFEILSGVVTVTGGNGGNGGHGSECNRSEVTNKGEKHVVGGRGGNGGNGGIAISATDLTISFGKVSTAGGNGGNTGKAGGVHDNDYEGWVFGNGTTTASDGAKGTAGKGGAAVSSDCTVNGYINDFSQTNGNDGIVTPGTNT